METYQVKEIKASDLKIGDEVWGINEGDTTYKWHKVTEEDYQSIQRSKNAPDVMMLVKVLPKSFLEPVENNLK